jgi:hypothetical protein
VCLRSLEGVLCKHVPALSAPFIVLAIMIIRWMAVIGTFDINIFSLLYNIT